ncbi:aromatic acid exporter family protein [uncultured Friedmanniella sp.]|uniref:FUSC family protein n=1 Tax=uncultured Friedmanniella sp. TaxID=335381 RepID=UPI0035CC9900
MAERLQQVRSRLRSSLRQALWWVWPAYPQSWSAVPARLRPATAQIGRLTAAAVVAYLVADAVTPGILDLTAPLTALLVVQASTVGTLQMGLVRVGAVLTGVLVAVGIASTIGLTWYSLALVIAASLALARLLRLGDQSLETPISAMLILAVSAPEMAAEGRVVNTLIGSVIGVAFSLLLPVSIPSARATSAVRRVAHAQAALLDEVALTLADRAPHPEELQAWSDWLADIEGDVDAAGAAVRAVEESRRLNARALAEAKIHPGLQAALERLDRCFTAARALVVVIGRESSDAEDATDQPAVELRRAFAVVLDDVADAVRTFGDLVSAQFGGATLDRVEELRGRTAESVRETRAVLTELVLLDVDPRRQTPLWMLQGSVLAVVEQILLQLDPSPDTLVRRPAPDQAAGIAWLSRYRPTR